MNMYKKRKKDKKRKIIIICILVFCLITGFIVNVVITDRQLTIFEKTIKDSVLTVQKIIAYPFDFILNKIEENKEKNKMYEEYQLLKEENLANEHYKIENEELKKEINEMKELLNINHTLAEYTKLSATVIDRNLGYWYDTITINKGEHDGIEIGMPAVVGNGLIGKVISTTTFNSTIRLITATDVIDKISVKIQLDENNYVYGILSNYDSETKTHIIEGISETSEIKNGSLVTTTGMGNIFPAGILIGKITGVRTDTFDLSNVLEMQSDVNFDEINYVTLLKRNAW